MASKELDPDAKSKMCKNMLIVLLVFSLGMVIGGALWTAFIFGIHFSFLFLFKLFIFQFYPNPENLEMCGISVSSAWFEVYSAGENRYLVGNQCPGYDWTGQKSPYKVACARRIIYLSCLLIHFRLVNMQIV